MIPSKTKIIDDLKQIINKNFKIVIDNIPDNHKLFNGGFSFNSIQMIELTVAIEKYYNKQFDSSLLTEDNFRQLDVLADVIFFHLLNK